MEGTLLTIKKPEDMLPEANMPSNVIPNVENVKLQIIGTDQQQALVYCQVIILYSTSHYPYIFSYILYPYIFSYIFYPYIISYIFYPYKINFHYSIRKLLILRSILDKYIYVNNSFDILSIQ